MGRSLRKKPFMKKRPTKRPIPFFRNCELSKSAFVGELLLKEQIRSHEPICYNVHTHNAWKSHLDHGHGWGCDRDHWQVVQVGYIDCLQQRFLHCRLSGDHRWRIVTPGSRRGLENIPVVLSRKFPPYEQRRTGKIYC